MNSKPNVIAIIPARGGSRGIPRKNARLLNGKPLIEYIIDSASQSSIISKLYVSTDDAELALIAQKNNIDVLDRPAAKAQPDSTLDEVIVDAVETLEQQGTNPDIIVTLQPTCPLVSTRTIDDAILKCITEDCDTILTVVDDRHLAWTHDKHGTPVPAYKHRLNRQELPSCFRETGSIVVCKRSTLDAGSRIGSNTGIIELPKTESIDIDDYFDWWLAEKSLHRKKVCLHTIGNREFGLGHVYRTLTLADRLIDHEVSFLVNDKSMMAAKLIKDRFYPIQVVNDGEELHEIIKQKPDLVINDILSTDNAFINSLKAEGITTINFEDEGPGSLVADYVINAMYDTHPQRYDNEVYHGVEYCCLRDEFYTDHKSSRNDDVRNILLLFGGTDPNNMTTTLLKWLDKLPGEWNITVIAGIGLDKTEELKHLAKNAKHHTEIVIDTKVISQYMANADIAITSAGRTVFELTSLGIPMVVIANHNREHDHIFARTSPGTIYLGEVESTSEEEFCVAMNTLLKDSTTRAEMNKCLLASSIKDGINKVLGIIDKALGKSNGEAA